MQITATIKVIGEIKTGTSQASGNEWKRQDVVLGWEEPYGTEGRMREQLLQVSLTGKNVEKLAQLECKPGDKLTGNVDFSTRAKDGRVYNDIAFIF